jgi:hypothetical protein
LSTRVRQEVSSVKEHRASADRYPKSKRELVEAILGQKGASSGTSLAKTSRSSSVMSEPSVSANHQQFEEQVYKIAPSRSVDYHFAEGIVSTLHRKYRFEDVYKRRLSATYLWFIRE